MHASEKRGDRERKQMKIEKPNIKLKEREDEAKDAENEEEEDGGTRAETETHLLMQSREVLKCCWLREWCSLRI